MAGRSRGRAGGLIGIAALVLAGAQAASAADAVTPVSLPGAKGRVWSVAFSPDGRMLAGGGLDGVRLWDVASRKELRGLPHEVHFPAPHSVAFLDQGLTLAFLHHDRDERSALRLHDVESGKERSVINFGRVALYDFAFSADSRTLLLATGDGLLLTTDPDRDVTPLPGVHQFRLTRAALSSDGKSAVSADCEGAVFLWDVASRKPIATLRDYPNPYRRPAIALSLTYSPDGKTVAAGFRFGGIALWDVASRKEILSLPEGRGRLDVVAVTFSPDGKLLAAATKTDAPDFFDVVKLYDCSTGKEVGELRSGRKGKGSVDGVAFSPDGKLLATGGSDGVKLWDLTAFPARPGK